MHVCCTWAVGSPTFFHSTGGWPVKLRLKHHPIAKTLQWKPPGGGANTRRQTQTHALPHSMNKRQPRPCLRFPHGSAKARVRRLSERRERGERVEAVDERLRRLSRSKSWMIKVEAWAPPIRTDARGQGHSTRARRATGREPASQRGRSGGRCMREAAQGRRSDDTSRRTAPSKPPVG